MSKNQQEHRARLQEAALESSGVTSRSLRQAISRAVAAGGNELALESQAIPAVLHRYLAKLSRHAYQITDADVAALKEHGYSEDAIFELTVSAALGAGLGRLERGLSLLRGPSPEPEEAFDAFS